jgi:hypothetical protein
MQRGLAANFGKATEDKIITLRSFGGSEMHLKGVCLFCSENQEFRIIAHHSKLMTLCI